MSRLFHAESILARSPGPRVQPAFIIPLSHDSADRNGERGKQVLDRQDERDLQLIPVLVGCQVGEVFYQVGHVCSLHGGCGIRVTPEALARCWRTLACAGKVAILTGYARCQNREIHL